MRRKVKVMKNCKKIYPLIFWRTCKSCNEEVRREYIWKIFINSPAAAIVRASIYHYLCMKCCPTFEQAEKYAKHVKPII